MDSEKILDISWKTLIRISILVICFFIFYEISSVIVWFVFALTISILFNPVINFLQKRKIPRVAGIIFVYFGFFGIFSFSIYSIIPLFASEIHLFLQSFPQYFEEISPFLKGLGFQAFENMESFIESIGNSLDKMADSIFNVLFAVFGGFFSFFAIVTIAFFLSLEERAAEKTLMLLFPKKSEAYVLNLWQRCQKKVTGWFGARIIACLFVGAASYITFLLFSVKYPFALGLFAGVFNFIPYIGPIFTGVLLFLIIFPGEMLKAVFVLIVFILIQQIECNILSPLLMKKIIGIPPVVVIVALIIGIKLWGILGAFLAVPLAGILFEFLKDFLKEKREKKAITV